MGNWLSSTPSESQPSAQHSTANIKGNYSGNRGSRNIFGSDNVITTNNNYCNHGEGNASKDYTKILKDLYPPGSGYVSHLNRIQEPVEGTCTWVIEHPKYQEWLENKTSGLLWLSADPGCGKSVIASFLVKHLKIRSDAVVCYFFFKDDSEEQRSAAFALRAILHQLFMQKGSPCRYAEQEFKAKGKRFLGEVDTLWNVLVKAVAGGECGDVICVVDALDECGEETLTPLIRHITRFPGSQASNTPLKFLVTSRPYHNIEKELGSRATTIRLKGEDEVDALTADVTRVIDRGIKELELLWENPGGLGYLRGLLQSSADRTFLWVSLVLEDLKDSADDSAEEFTKIISTAPHDLTKFYTRVLDKSTDPEKARRILNIVVAAARPLTLREMNIAFKIKREHNSIRDVGNLPGGFERTVKNWCGLFVRVIDSKIYLVHQTAREFLIKGSLPGQGDWQYTLCPRNSSFVMADICIAYLSLQEFENDPLTMNAYGRVGEKLLHDFVKKYGFVDYAASHWADHFRDSQGQQIELLELTRQICGAGSNRARTWLRMYWFNGRLPYLFPQDLTHLMVASWLGQGAVVERLLEEGGDINARSELYGTALNIAASQRQGGITRNLLQRNVKAYFGGREYNILQTKKSELYTEFFESRFAIEWGSWEWDAAEFLLPFCIPDTPDPHVMSSSGTTFSHSNASLTAD